MKNNYKQLRVGNFMENLLIKKIIQITPHDIQVEYNYNKKGLSLYKPINITAE